LNQKEAQKLVSMTSRCPVDCTFNLIGKKFTIHILRNMIILGHTRFNEFETIEGINPKTLTVRLKEMLENDLIERKVYPGFPYFHTSRMYWDDIRNECYNFKVEGSKQINHPT
jgi:DNA-binding HxlR family transcriptional regulator